MKEAYLYKKLPQKKVQCQTCAHYCLLSLGKKGKCGARKNIDGKLYSLTYGKIVAMYIDPIEKKPFYHFLPGAQSLSIAAVGCPFSCFNCQNFDISQGYKDTDEIPGQDISPEEIVKMAIDYKLPTISYTYTDPIAFLEYALDIMKLAKQVGLKNSWVSNGFLSKESAKFIIPYLDAINIDIKSFSEEFYQKFCGGRLQPVLNTAKLMKKSGVWTEITTLVIPTLSDSEETLRKIAKFIKNNLGAKTPWHITQFSGKISWKLKNTPDTSVETLKMVYKIGKEIGLKYVYTGNVPGLPTEDTFCPKCGTLCIDRTNYIIHRHDKNGKCPKCGTSLDMILN